MALSGHVLATKRKEKSRSSGQRLKKEADALIENQRLVRMDFFFNLRNMLGGWGAALPISKSQAYNFSTEKCTRCVSSVSSLLRSHRCELTVTSTEQQPTDETVFLSALGMWRPVKHDLSTWRLIQTWLIDHHLGFG